MITADVVSTAAEKLLSDKPLCDLFYNTLVCIHQRFEQLDGYLNNVLVKLVSGSLWKKSAASTTAFFKALEKLGTVAYPVILTGFASTEFKEFIKSVSSQKDLLYKLAAFLPQLSTHQQKKMSSTILDIVKDRSIFDWSKSLDAAPSLHAEMIFSRGTLIYVKKLALRNNDLFVRTIKSSTSFQCEGLSNSVIGPKKKKPLFKLARNPRRTMTYDHDKIDFYSAMAEYNLKETDLAGLPSTPRLRPATDELDPCSTATTTSLYSLDDVYQTALKVHGSKEAVNAQRRPLIPIEKKLTEAELMRTRMRVEAEHPTSGADRVVAIAFIMNTCDMVLKYIAAYLTGSKSIFAEAIHSTMDTCNQLILLLGIHYSRKHPNPQFPYGYGNMRYVTSLISGCGILGFGCGLSIYHGISGLLHPATLETLTYAYYALAMSFCFQGAAAITAYREIRIKANKAGTTISNYVRTAADPSLNVVLLEDTAAVTGVKAYIYFYFITLFDALGSVAIGGLLGTVAMFIIRTNAQHLVGRSLPQRITQDIVARLNNDPAISSVHDVKATALGVEQSRFKAELDFDGRMITRRYIEQETDIHDLFQQVKSLESEEELQEWMEDHGEKIIDRLGILFLDVLFPLDVQKIIFVDADQVVRSDLIELMNYGLDGNPYGYVPFCDSRQSMEGFRFWKQGYRRNHLAGRKYHISALYVVDLHKFRQIAAGDRLRGQYQGLSADPNSLSNLDQDLPNNMIHQVRIKSLPQEWLWCETWCDDESKGSAKTIDLCNNPQTKEPKLESAQRIIPEWRDYDREIKEVISRRREGLEAKSAKVDDHTEL
ncbi:unnamed protein product, partial [Mesorhabditis belari]|uniref:Proton-coupled zinc antiporter SLC30A9, mitochondrial n=1 Tax=Mesorhabditis belari TaxID=2138241 RepID=A0AAF3EB15_9BILA